MRHLRLGTSTYSYWHFTEQKVPIETVIDHASALGLDGVEILHKQLESEENSYLQRLKRHAFRNGVALYNLSTHQDFVTDDADERQRQVKNTLGYIDLAHQMGIPSIRVNAGFWRHQDSFDDLISARGWVEPWPGSTAQDGFDWAIDSLSACIPHAERQGVQLLLENHWGLTTTAAGMLRIVESIDSPWLRAVIDVGNFYFEEDPYVAIEKVAPHTDLLHAKTYPGGGLIYTLDLDYVRIFSIMQNSGFQGYVSLEMEGHEAAETAVPKSIALLRHAWAEAQAASEPNIKAIN